MGSSPPVSFRHVLICTLLATGLVVPTTSTPNGLAEHIAAGVGLTPSSSASSFRSTAGTTYPHWSNGTEIAAHVTGTVSGSLDTALSHGTASPRGTSTSYHASNASITGDCWNQWNTYWTASENVGSFYETIITINVTEIRAPTFYASSVQTFAPTTITRVLTEYGPDGNFPVATETDIETIPGDTGTTEFPTSTGKTYTSTERQTLPSNVYPSQAKLITPACSLPSIVPQCQSQWDEYIVGRAGLESAEISFPVCQAASVNSRQCSSLISAMYDEFRVFGDTGIPGWVTSGSSTFWPTSRSFAPSCTLGCQSCAITGNTVQVLYWPPSTASLAENGTMTARQSQLAGLGSGNASDLIIAIVDNTTLTSPTIYVSYKSLYASNSCSQVGRRYSNTIIPLANNKDLHSLAYHQLDDMPLGPGLSGSGVSWDYEQQPFNLSDLIEPIPNSIYNQLPWCQSALGAYSRAGFNTSSFVCSPHGPYAPLIAVPTEVRNLDPDWASCTAWYGGLYDPPKALQGVSVMATVTVPTVKQTTSASARSTADAGLPTETAGTQPGTTALGSPAATQDGGVAATSTSKSSIEDPAATAADPGLSSSQQNAAPQESTQASSTADPQAPAATQGTTIDPADPTTGGISAAGIDPASSAAGPATGAEAATADPATAAQATTNALSVLISALDSSSSITDLPSVKTTNAGQSAGSLTGVGATLPAVETVLTLSLPGPAGQASTGGSPADGSPSTIVVSEGQTATLPGVGVVVAQSSGLVVSGSTVPYASVESQATQDPASTISTAGSETYTVLQATGTAGGVSVEGAGSTEAVGEDSTLVIGGQTVAAQSSGELLVGSRTLVLPQVITPDPTNPIVTVGSKAYTVASQVGDPSAVIIADGGSALTLTAGAVATLGGQLVSALQSGGAIVGAGSSAETVQPAQASQTDEQGQQGIVTIGSEVMTVSTASAGIILENGHTTATLPMNGAAVTVGTQLVSAGSSGQLLVGSSTFMLPSTLESAAVFSVGSSTATAVVLPGQSGEVAIDGETLSIGGSAQTINGQIVSAGASGLVLGVSTTVAFSQITSAGETDDVLTLGSSKVTATAAAGQSGEVVIGDKTLSAGGLAATINGQLVSEGADGIVLGGSTTVSLPQITSEAQSGIVVTLGGSTMTAIPIAGQSGEVAIDGTTLFVGGPAQTFSGGVVSEASGGLVIGGSTTMAFSRVTASPSPTSAQSSSPHMPESPLPSTTSGEGRVANVSWLVLWLAAIAAMIYCR